MDDAFVVIPSSLSSYSITGFTASYGLNGSDSTAQYIINIIDAAGAPQSPNPYTHTGGQKVQQDTISPPIALGNGYTIFLDIGGSAPDNGALGYTITFELSI
jgi:hypothetical protein